MSRLRKKDSLEELKLSYCRYNYVPPHPKGDLCMRNICYGREICDINGKRYEVTETNPLLINCDESCSLLTDPGEQVKTHVIYWSKRVINQIFLAHSLPFEKSVDVDWNSYSRGIHFGSRLKIGVEIVNSIVRELEREVYKYPFYDMECLEEKLLLLLKTIFLIQRGLQDHIGDVQSVGASQRAEIIKRVLIGKEFIDSCFNRKISISDVAEVAGLSKYHFIRLFSGIFKLTPRQYLINKRFELAGKLLLTTDKEIAEIAMEIGLENPSHFIMRFKSIYSLTPGDFRKMSPGNDWNRIFTPVAE